jgi:hypothetical protein
MRRSVGEGGPLDELHLCAIAAIQCGHYGTNAVLAERFVNHDPKRDPMYGIGMAFVLRHAKYIF